MKETGGVRICLVEVEYNFQRIRERLTSGWVVDDGEGVERASRGFVTGRFGTYVFTDSFDICPVDPFGSEREAFVG